MVESVGDMVQRGGHAVMKTVKTLQLREGYVAVMAQLRQNVAILAAQTIQSVLAFAVAMARTTRATIHHLLRVQGIKSAGVLR